MAGIDKTYVNRAELREAVDWANKVGTATLENGYRFRPIEWIRGYNDIDDPEFWTSEESDYYILWNTPTWYDRWLWLNCPLPFVKERLKEQYGDGLKDFETWTYQDPKEHPDFGKQKYTFLKFPKWHGVKWWLGNGRRKNPWPGKSKQLTLTMEIYPKDRSRTEQLYYEEKTDEWNPGFGMLPCGRSSDYIWQNYHKRIPTKKSIIRELRHWYIPPGYIVRLSSLSYTSFDFEVLVR